MNKFDNIIFDNNKLFNLTEKASDFFVNTVNVRPCFGSTEHNTEQTDINNILDINQNSNICDILRLCSNDFLYKRIKKGEVSLSTLLMMEYIVWENKKISLLSDYLEKNYNFKIDFHNENNESEKDNFLTQWNDFVEFVCEQVKLIKKNNHSLFIANYDDCFISLSKILDKPINVNNFYFFVNCFYSYFIFKKLEKLKPHFLKTSFLLKDKYDKKSKNLKLKIIETSFILSDFYHKKEKKIINRVIGNVHCLDLNDNCFYNFRLFSTEIFDYIEYKNKPRYKKYPFYSKPDFSIFTPGTDLIVSNDFCDSEKINDPYFNLPVISNYLYKYRIKEIHHEKMGRIF